jgi:leucyl aminopeptidase
MEIKIYEEPSGDKEASIIFVLEDENTVLPAIPKEITGILNTENFHLQPFQVRRISWRSAENIIRHYIIAKLGARNKTDRDNLKKVTSDAIKECLDTGISKVQLFLPFIDGISSEEVLACISEAVILTDYSFHKYRNSHKVNLNEVVIIASAGKTEWLKGILAEVMVTSKYILLARDLVNEPPNIMNPGRLAEEAIMNGQKCGFAVEVIKRDEIAKLGMSAFLSVSNGSEEDPLLIVMRYKGDPGSNAVTALAGKGITFDSGGLSIKSTELMSHMKSDMAGAAGILGAICIAAQMKLKINVVGVIAAGENMISGKAYRPSDIVRTMAGKTIEIVNTDAEGRLALADSIYYAILHENANTIIDVATLAGGVITAVGDKYAAVFSNDETLYATLEKAANLSGERIWRFPLDGGYRELINSDIADLKNYGGRNASIITSALFIQEFINEAPWIHIDISSAAWAEKAHSYYSKGGTGACVKLLYIFLRILSESEKWRV